MKKQYGNPDSHPFFTVKYLSDNFRKNIYCNFECGHDIGKNGGCSRSNVFLKNYLKICTIFFNPFSWTKWVLEVFFKTPLKPSITYISAIKISSAIFEEIWFFDFSKSVFNCCKKFFVELILGVNSSCSGSHLPLQYRSNPSGGIQPILILLRPFGTQVKQWEFVIFCNIRRKIFERSGFI